MVVMKMITTMDVVSRDIIAVRMYLRVSLCIHLIVLVWSHFFQSSCMYVNFTSHVVNGACHCVVTEGSGTNWKVFEDVKAQNLGQEKAEYFTCKGTVVFIRKENCMYTVSNVTVAVDLAIFISVHSAYLSPLSSDRQHLSCDVCLEVRGEIIRTVLFCIVYWSCAQS